jgi:2Fe-2S ferredoxin
MAGTNPYIDTPTYVLPKQPYSITIYSEGEPHTFTVEPRHIPYERSGLPGSILDICEGHDIPLEHTCGGVLACSTCHVIIREGMEACNEASEDEEDQLEEAPGLTSKSRLGCQCVPNGSRSIVVEIPRWNRNAVKEAPHD